ncbi:MAG TPA: NAD(P)H-dependent oxidoreductase [Ktedonosporobacter sp.]|nr:NAD(P)H-dependent oxidoreductase [Ktedonosporobacter sp.]
MSSPPLQICLIGGSAEYPSRILACLDFLAPLLQVAGATTRIWDLAQDPLPLLGPLYYPDPFLHTSEAVRKFAYLASQADAFVWGSPVYHNSFSGVLKNALDSLSIPQFRHKPVAFISCGNSDRTGSQPCDHLRMVACALHAVAVPTQLVALPSDFTAAHDRYHLTNAGLQERMASLAKELIVYATIMRTLRTRTTSGSLRAQTNGLQNEEIVCLQDPSYSSLSSS